MKIYLLSLFFLFAIVGCSSGSDNSDGSIGAMSIPQEAGTPIVSPDESGTTDDSVTQAESDVVDESTISNETGNTNAITNSELTVPTSIGQDPLSQNNTQVTFEVTVPAYQSNELQVRITWNGIELTAAWVGDEFWSVTAELPTDVEALLVATFSDNNGVLTLASYETSFRTGTNASESLVITADNFDSALWDIDMDGISNLAEVIAGTNPLVEETETLEIRDSIEVRDSNRDFQLELLLPAARPYVDVSLVQEPTECQFVFDCTTYRQDITLDESGSGSIFNNRDFNGAGNRNNDVTVYSATRVVSNDSLTWSGMWSHSFERDFLEIETYTISTVRINEQVFRKTGEVRYSQDRNQPPTTVVTLDTNFDLTGRVVANSNGRCEPFAGSIELLTVPDSNVEFLTFWPRNLVSRTATKREEERFWTITDVFSGDQLVQRYWVESIGDFFCEPADL